MDMFSFYMGHCFDAYSYLGAHPKKQAVTFRTFAPAASAVSLLWQGEVFPMEKIYDGNFYELTLDAARPGDFYEYRIYDRQGGYTDHADPYGFQMELRPGHRSVITEPEAYLFHDEKWMRERDSSPQGPLNIYELHLGSWRKKEDDTWLSYEELAEPLADYLLQSGYNYVEFLPLSEHPADESWGYQNTGFFAPTSRYGTPAQCKKLIDTLHQRGIGVILDFVPVHFALDSYGLGRYDGTPLYEYPHRDVGVSEWGSYNFMHSRGEVRSFLESSANYWLQEFHFDGLRLDAVSRLLYWQGDPARGENGRSVEFLKIMNQGLKERNPQCLLIAEDSTDYPLVTTPVDKGGLGFDYKWDMGWMHDTLDFFQASPWERIQRYHQLTFSMVYFPKERYLLSLSHDEVVHGKATILGKMYGSYEEKFAQARAMYLYMYVHPGKKLLFMGNEFGQLREWDEKRQQDWSLLTYPSHSSFCRFMTELNHLYLDHTALWEEDYQGEGFSWPVGFYEDKVVYVIERRSRGECLWALLNFSDKVQTISPSSRFHSAQLLLNTDWEIYGGKSPLPKEETIWEAGEGEEEPLTEDDKKEKDREKKDGEEKDKEAKLSFCLQPYSGLLFKMR